MLIVVNMFVVFIFVQLLESSAMERLRVCSQPLSQTVNQHQPFMLCCEVHGSGELTYQWVKDLRLTTATGPHYTVMAVLIDCVALKSFVLVS